MSISEYIELDTSERIELRRDRGVSVSGSRDSRHAPHDGAIDDVDEAVLLRAIRSALLPDEGDLQDAGENYPWHEYSALAELRGVQVLPQELRALPFEVDISDTQRPADPS
ncbi:hypothetical protein [Microbacterium karelineae]|uniref:hypothetical protein n=1 Tax=Microbacterium karelineae TaxID=2654283 RepID=UPI0012EA2008|nr:hypothetical protein [Microbacterium karelineae]